MARDAELDRLKVKQQHAFDKKQAAYKSQQSAWEKRSSARDSMNRAYEIKQRAYEEQNRTWQHYQSVRSANGPRIDTLNAQQEQAFQNMKRSYDSASAAYESRNGAAASSYAEEGRRYKAEAQGYVVERRRLVEEIRTARAQHEATKPAFQQAKESFSACKRTYDSTKAVHEKAQAEFKTAKANFDSVAQTFKSRLKVVKTQNQKQRDDRKEVARRAGVPTQYHDDVWINQDSDGNVNIYFGGVGKADGPGHGHYVMNRRDEVTYKRDPFDPHGGHNFTDNDDRHESTDDGSSGGTLYDRRARPNKTPMGVATRDNLTGNRDGRFFDRNRSVDLHVTQYYDDNRRVSWDTDGENDREHHWTDQNLNQNDPDAHTPPPGAKE